MSIVFPRLARPWPPKPATRAGVFLCGTLAGLGESARPYERGVERPRSRGQPLLYLFGSRFYRGGFPPLGRGACRSHPGVSGALAARPRPRSRNRLRHRPLAGTDGASFSRSDWRGCIRRNGTPGPRGTAASPPDSPRRGGWSRLPSLPRPILRPLLLDAGVHSSSPKRGGPEVHPGDFSRTEARGHFSFSSFRSSGYAVALRARILHQEEHLARLQVQAIRNGRLPESGWI